MTTTLVSSEARCSLCGCNSSKRVAITIADDPEDTSRSALTLRTMTTVICQGCITKAQAPRHFGRHRWDEGRRG